MKRFSTLKVLWPTDSEIITGRFPFAFLRPFAARSDLKPDHKIQPQSRVSLRTQPNPTQPNPTQPNPTQHTHLRVRITIAKYFLRVKPYTHRNISNKHPLLKKKIPYFFKR